jgi:hypothetical protein
MTDPKAKSLLSHLSREFSTPEQQWDWLNKNRMVQHVFARRFSKVETTLVKGYDLV